MSKNAKLMSTAPSSCFVRDTCVHPCGMHRQGMQEYAEHVRKREEVLQGGGLIWGSQIVCQQCGNSDSSWCCDCPSMVNWYFNSHQMETLMFQVRFQCGPPMAGPHGPDRPSKLFTPLLGSFATSSHVSDVCGPELSFRTASFLACRFKWKMPNFCQVLECSSTREYC